MSEVKITNWQGILFIVSTIVPSALLSLPSILLKYADKDAWISIVLTTGIGMMLAVIYSTVFIKNPGLTIFDIIENKLGIFFRMIIGLLLMLYYFLDAISVLRSFIYFMVDTVMEQTPPVVIGGMGILIALYAIYQGIEVISRVNMIIIIISFLTFSFSTLFYLKEMDFRQLLPIFETSWNKIALGGVPVLSWVAEVAIILVLAPYLQHNKDVRKVAVIGILITGITLTWTLVGMVAVFSADILPMYHYPTFSVFRIIEVANFIERIDALFIAVWMGTMMMKLTIFLFSSLHCFFQTFRIKQEQPFLFPFGLLVLSFCLNSWKNQSEYALYQHFAGISYSLFFNILIPLCLFFIGFLKNRKKQVKL
ncbi:GerAB/ArcD/ProY family transporter [Metabacillus halosaccharovorans]|uniref:GerAB/ArcD/ProY family transporter n=1 Tax=Metabacillus halosaccharovorans TaxID=930124 RepID=UPI003736B48F